MRPGPTGVVDVGRLFEWETLVCALAGLALTGVTVDPGEYAVGVGVVEFDPFYALVGLFAALAVSAGASLLSDR